MGSFRFDRAEMLARLQRDSFDVVVVGGGITGVGVALDAASRGLRTALIERDDFGSGTSSKSSKLVHGGLRYLQQGEVGLVYEALHERQRLRRIAPHLVRVVPFMIPILAKDGLVSTKLARAFGSALWMYDLTGGWRIGRRHRRLSADEAVAHLPTMAAERLRSAYLYFDAATDDARLCLTVARTAAEHGATVVNGCAFAGLDLDAEGHVQAVTAVADGRTIRVRTRAVVNAAGVWAPAVAAGAGVGAVPALRPAKGIHVMLPWDKVRNDIAVLITTADGRPVFVVPWDERDDGGYRFTYVGTTDTAYEGSLDDPQCTPEDLDYVLEALNASITTGITTSDVIGTWAGLRPLVADTGGSGRRRRTPLAGRTADLSRRHRVAVDDAGVVTVFGGKLTTYRRMAEDTVDALTRHLGVRARCRTRRLVLLGGDGYREPRAGSSTHLAHRYGSDAGRIAELISARPELAQPLVPSLAYLQAEAIHAVRHEMARSVDDVLSRRTRARILDRDAADRAADAVAELIGPELGWDGVMMAASADDFRAALARERAAESGSGELAPPGAGTGSASLSR